MLGLASRTAVVIASRPAPLGDPTSAKESMSSAQLISPMYSSSAEETGRLRGRGTVKEAAGEADVETPGEADAETPGEVDAEARAEAEVGARAETDADEARAETEVGSCAETPGETMGRG